MNFYPSILTSCWGCNFQYTPALYKKNGNTLPRVRMNLKIRPPRPSRLPLGAYFPIHPSAEYSFIHYNLPHCCHHRHLHHRLALGIALIILQSTLSENRIVVYTSHVLQYECVTKANTFVLLTIQSRTFTKGFTHSEAQYFQQANIVFFHWGAPRVC